MHWPFWANRINDHWSQKTKIGNLTSHRWKKEEKAFSPIPFWEITSRKNPQSCLLCFLKSSNKTPQASVIRDFLIKLKIETEVDIHMT